MISFKRDENKVIASVNDSVTNTDWLFEFNLDSKSRAEICKRHFDEKFKERIKKIRKTAYEEGYKNGRNHEKKIKSFSCYMDNDKVGWRF